MHSRRTDDIAITLVASSRKKRVGRAELVLTTRLQWEIERGLIFSVSEPTAIILKGGLVPGFTLKFGIKKIVTLHSVKYIGLMSTTKKNLTILSRLRGVSGHSWGVKETKTNRIYNWIFIPKITYVAGSLHKTALLGKFGAYNTSGTHSLHAITGKFPFRCSQAWLQGRVQIM